MKDWKLWAVVVILFLIVKACGGCNGCENDSDIPEQKPTTYTRTCRACGRTFETHHEDDQTCSSDCYRRWERQKASFKKYGY